MKLTLQRLAAPMLIEPQWLRVMVGIASRGKLDAKAVADARAEWDARKAAGPKAEEPGAPVEGTGGTLRIIGGIGVLSIEGPLFRHADIFCDISGGTSYDAIWRGLEAAVANPRVTAILLRVNSPGGEADGCNELAKGIAAARERKPVWTYVESICASAAYWLASQTDRIVAEECAELGSIGVRCGIIDDSAHDEMHGIRDIEIISSQSPAKRSTPVDDDVIGRLQTRIDDLAAIFVASVARGRGVDEQVVLDDYGQGDVMIASKAITAGLADDIGNFDSTLAALIADASDFNSTAAARASARAHRGAATMTTKKKADGGGDEEQDKTMRCAKCDADMSGKKGYCASCYDGDEEEPDGDEEEEAKAAGLFGGKRKETRARLIAFAVATLHACGAKTAAAALGKITANASAADELASFRAKTEKDAATARTASFGEKLATAIAGGRVTLAMATKEVPLLLGAAKADARKALEAIPVTLAQTAEDKKAGKKAVSGWTGPNVVAALASVPITADALESLEEWISAKGPALPAARAAAPPTGHNVSIVQHASADATRGIEIDSDGNPTAPRARAFSVADIAAAAANKTTKENVR